MANPDVSRIINSDEVQSVVRPAGPKYQKRAGLKKNPLRNPEVMLRMNPYVKSIRRAELLKQTASKDKKKVKSTTAASFLSTLKSD